MAKATKKTTTTTKKKATKKVAKKKGGKGKLGQVREVANRALKNNDWEASLDPKNARKSLPHLPMGSLIINHLIGGKPNRFGVAPCPGLPKGRILNLYGHEGSGKCLPADTLISTPNGLCTVEEIFQSQDLGCTSSNWTEPRKVELINFDGEPETTTHFTSNGKRPLTAFTTFTGSEIRSTANHPHLVMSARGQRVWKKTKDIESGDVLVSLRKVPAGTRELAADKAYLLGVLVADGHFDESRISVCNDDLYIKDFLRAAPGLPAPKEYANNDPQEGQEPSVGFHFNSKEAVSLLYEETGWQPCVAAGKHVGALVRSLDQGGVREFLRGYLDCESFVDSDKAELEVSSASKKLLEEVRMLLRVFEVQSLLRPKRVAAYPDTEYWRLTVSGSELRRYIEKVGTRSPQRMEKLEMVRNVKGNTNFDSIPNAGGLLRDLYATLETDREMHHLFADYMTRRSGQPPRARLTWERGLQISHAVRENSLNASLLKQLGDMVDSDFFYDEVVTVSEPSTPEPTFDFAMEETHSFIANGFVTHNTTVALECAAETCRNGGVVGYIDWEHEIVPDYAQALGVPVYDQDKFMLVQPDTLDDGVALLWTMASAGVDLIVLDSVGAGVPKAYFEKSVAETAEQGRLGMNAAVWSSFLPKLKTQINKTQSAIIGISQIRAAISTGGYGEQITVQGGKAWKFYSALRMKLQRVKTEKASDYSALTNKTEERVVGALIKAKLDKCKVSPQQGNEELFYIRWGEGIDDLRSRIEIGSAHRVVKKAGSWISWIQPDGNELRMQGMEKFRAAFAQNDQMRKALEKQVKPFMASGGAGAANPVDDEEEVFDGDNIVDDAELQEILGSISGESAPPE